MIPLPHVPDTHFVLDAAQPGELVPTPFGRRAPVLFREGIWAAYRAPDLQQESALWHGDARNEQPGDPKPAEDPRLR